MYVQCQEEMEKNLRYEDLVTHMKTYYALSLDYERSEMEYRHRRLVMDATQELRKDDVGLEAGARLRHDRDRIQRRMGGLCCLICGKLCCCCSAPPSPRPQSSALVPSPARSAPNNLSPGNTTDT